MKTLLRIFIAFLLPLALFALCAGSLQPQAYKIAALLLMAWFVVLLAPKFFGLRFLAGILGTDPAGTLLDNVAQYGSQTVTYSSKVYVVEKFTPKRSTARVVQKNQFGVPSGKTLTKDLETATVTVQLPDSSAVAWPLFAEISLVPEGGGSAKVFHVEENSPLFEQNGITKFTANLSEKLGS